jgi:VanZ family protein
VRFGERLVARLAELLRGREWLPAIVWALAILAVSSIPNPNLGGTLFPGCDKVAHFIEYSILGALLGFWASGRAPRFAGALVAAAILLAALDEVHQRFIPGREMDFWDFSADAAGIVVGFLVSRRYLARRARRRDA